MRMETKLPGAEDAEMVAAATAGDETAFTTLTRLYRRELHVHCYRMLASFEDAEDMVQETFLKAWQKRETFQGRATFRAWLYRIATNACLDFLDRTDRRVTEIAVRGGDPDEPMVAPHIAWLQPYPDRLLERAAPGDIHPDAQVVRKETIELAFVVTMQLLPPKQRAVLILRDVLDWSAAEAADLLDSSVAAVNGALQRARASVREHQPTRETHQMPNVDLDQERRLIQQYVEATERNDTHAILQLLRADVRFSMPPEPIAYIGREASVQSWVEGGFGSPPYDDWKWVVTYANRMPAIAFYLRRADTGLYHPFTMDMLRIEDGVISEITTFDLRNYLDIFGLPATLS